MSGPASGATARRLETPIPKSMRTLERDARGYPIPFIVMRDKSGKPQFTINDFRMVEKCRSKRLCAICGKRLDGKYWFVGGSRCFIHEHGAFVDPPLHEECARYALRVCPFLAAPSYAKRIDDRLLKAKDRPDGVAIATVAHMLPEQPERFGLGLSRFFSIIDTDQQGLLYKVPRWDYVEWWKAGEQVNAPPADIPDGDWVDGGRL